MKPFDVEATPLAGVNLVEASAGTGKTWSLARLAVRLVAERRMEVNRILIVTFTEAATEELRVKVRDALSEALARAPQGDGAAFLREALVGFDQAAIHTIHAFCRRVLLDSAFESGALFDGELITDQSALVQEAADDFWRSRAEGFSPLYLPYLRSARVSPETLAEVLSRHGARPGMRVQPDARAPKSPPKAEQAFLQAFERFAGGWDEEAEGFLRESPALSRQRYSLGSTAALTEAVRRLIAGGPDPRLCKDFEKLTPGTLSEAFKKGHAATRLPAAFDAAGVLAAAADALLADYGARTAVLRAEALQEAGRRLRERKASLGVSYFDDLLLDLHRALTGRGGRGLAASVRDRYDAALVDEAQDTDPVQFEIFDRIFGARGPGGADTPFFIIGDPKQAIYSFRGADVHAYLEARASAQARFTLDANRRSRPPLVAAVNALFGARPRPFFAEGIEYSAARAVREEGGGGVADLPAASVWLLRRGPGGRPPSKQVARDAVGEAVAGDIVRLLERGLARPGDVAVLTRSNSHASQMQAHLRARGVPSVRNVSESPFACEEADELQRVLAAVVEPGRAARLRAAVATDLVGLTAEEIHGLADAGWEDWAERFADYADTWSRRGFYPMFRLLMDREKVTVRLLRLADGELRLARLAELAEKLHETAVRERLGMEALLKWLADARLAPPDAVQEPASLMETDSDAVHIATIHLAKGCEWPVVYCPFLWDLPEHRGEDSVVCHEDGGLVLDLGTPDIGPRRERSREEQLAEELRLLYVALTRARERLVLSWATVKGAEKSALGYLLEASAADEKGDGEIRARLQRLSSDSGGAIAVEDVPDAGRGRLRREAGRPELLAAREAAAAIDGSFRITSFTALARPVGPARADGQARAEREARGPGETLGRDDGADRDQEPGLAGLLAAARPGAPDVAAAGQEPAFLQFPRGARAGTFVHAVLEKLDFAVAGGVEARELIGGLLRDHGYEESWLPALLDMSRRAAALALGSGRLAEAGRAQTIREVPFAFPLRLISPRSLAGLLGLAEERFSAAPVRGFLRGYIDLVVQAEDRFWLVDWKSNYLGPGPEDYGGPALEAVMTADLYGLQCRLYALALHRMLRLRQPGYDYERHFGGVIYAFVRGMGLGPDGGGVLSVRPEAAEIARLEQELVDP